ncbi:MAG: hypothetical protein F6K39_44700 [Okeania sp. SIO3B3]|nr:hypothetical protein [Okeania sp. SIO3B3]
MILILIIEESGVRSQEGRKKKQRVVEGESFLFALLSRHDIIPLFTNAVAYNIPKAKEFCTSRFLEIAVSEKYNRK